VFRSYVFQSRVLAAYGSSEVSLRRYLFRAQHASGDLSGEPGRESKMRGGSRTDLGVQEAQLEVARVAGDVHVTSSTTLPVNLGQLLPSL
jgi:hypothetical protein